MEKIVTIVVLQFIGKVWGLLLKAANMEKTRYNRRIAELLELIKLIIGGSKCRKNCYDRSIAVHLKSMGFVIERSKYGKKSLQS